MASGRKRLWNLAAATHPTYGETFLDRTERSDSSSGTAYTQEHVPESQSQGRSSAHEHVPPAQYELPPYYPQYEADYQPHRTRLRSIAGMFDVLADTNPALAAMWQNVRPTINSNPTPEEQAELEQRSIHHSAEIFDDINLDN
ncbi:hypothetical protein F2Q68_00011916 [Brassica cretica]|uniref:Uncharacterized protein n=1 Tax=Brassica cretica TaxID=69181 RepID=A0A8S9KQ25_BRACR|nr:hypothetical protein F2Q68_00011916 [Brassica cretica]